MEKLTKSRITFLMAALILFGGALLARAAYIQLARQPRLEHLAKRQFESKVLIRPRRGAILDRNGEPLAINVEVSSLAADPAKIENKRAVARLLSHATGIPYAKLLEKLAEKREFIWIKRHLKDSELARLRKWNIIDAGGAPNLTISGLWLVKESQRIYPHGELAAHVLGDVNIDGEGLEGVELWMNEGLRGKVVSMSAVKDALGRPTFIDAQAANLVKDGAPATLTLDASLQYSVEQELKAAVRKTSARGGSVIVMNAVTGEILAMANEPSFNPNEKGFSPDRRRNRALTDGYEPGSTMKPVLLASALTHGWKLTDQVWGGMGQFTVQGKKISEAEAKEQFEWLNLKKIIQVSSNVGAAKVALKLGAETYLNTLKSFGFGTRTEIGFPGEISGRVPEMKEWHPLTLANIGFGQGILVTPLQMVRAYATFLNGGMLVPPTLLKVVAGDSPPVVPKLPRRILSPRVCQQVLEALESVTQDGGTGINARLEGYRVAGKTGTAQEVDPSTGAYSRTRYVASFIGFPVGLSGADQKIVIFTSIDEPRGVYYAAETAAPLFREVLGAVANRFSLPSEETAPRLAVAPVKDNVHWAQAQVQGPAAANAPATALDAHPRLTWHGVGPTGAFQWSMPAMKGLAPREAIRLLQGHQFELEVHGTGIVTRQYPEEHQMVAEGDKIRLILSEP